MLANLNYANYYSALNGNHFPGFIIIYSYCIELKAMAMGIF
jgi:hypothetical protein